MKKKHTAKSGFLRACAAFLVCGAAASSILSGALLAVSHSEPATKISERTFTFAQRVIYQRAIEEVYWRHRIWPEANANPKPSLGTVMSETQLKKKVTDYLRNSQALEDYWQRPVTSEDLQAEMDRMARDTRQPDMLGELFGALGNDPFVIAECLARPILAERLLAYAGNEQVKQNSASYDHLVAATGNYRLPSIPKGVGCTNDTWEPTSTSNASSARDLHTAIWTGSEMIVWGGFGSNSYLNTGGKYNPATDSWTATTLTNAPAGRFLHTAVWTGSEMIVWGGDGDSGFLNSGGRYNPVTNTWTATSTTNAPSARDDHTAVWTGSEMIVWGGSNDDSTGGRYNPSTDTWTATPTFNAPSYREGHTAVWTGTEMIIWGGVGGPPGYVNTGGKYNPTTNTWTATSTANAPDPRDAHTAVWTGSEMIVWGGGYFDGQNSHYFNTGGRYNPGTDVWSPTSVINAPEPRFGHTAVWTDSEMIVWGGVQSYPMLFNTGGRYNPATDSWAPTSTTGAPDHRESHVAVWTGTQMIVWGGFDGNDVNTGGRYCAAPATTCTPGAVVLLQGSITSNDPTHHSVNGAASSCAVSPPCPGELLGAYHYHAYQLTNSCGNPVCITLTLSDPICIYSEIYLGSFDPNNSCTNYLADSTGAGSYSVTIPGNATIWVVAEEFQQGHGCENYTVTVSGLPGSSSPTPTPTATPTGTATATPSATGTPTATPTGTPRATPTPRFNPTPRLRPTPQPRP